MPSKDRPKAGAQGMLLHLVPPGRDLPSSPLHIATIGDASKYGFKLFWEKKHPILTCTAEITSGQKKSGNSLAVTVMLTHRHYFENENTWM